MDVHRLEQQFQFILEIDKLKRVRRQTLLIDSSRRENAAEHSWHLAVMAVVLQEYAADPGLNLLRVIQMLLVHDIVEIDAGDTYCYDEAAAGSQGLREAKAADRLFSLLPAAQATEFHALWDEFEAAETPEACFARSLDRLQPVLNNYHTRGAVWRQNGIQSSQVIARNRMTADSAPDLWQYFNSIIQRAVSEGFLAK